MLKMKPSGRAGISGYHDRAKSAKSWTKRMDSVCMEKVHGNEIFEVQWLEGSELA